MNDKIFRIAMKTNFAMPLLTPDHLKELFAKFQNIFRP